MLPLPSAGKFWKPCSATDMARVVLLYSRCIDARARPVLCVVACCECCI